VPGTGLNCPTLILMPCGNPNASSIVYTSGPYMLQINQ
jgi:hypothetical protein